MNDDRGFNTANILTAFVVGAVVGAGIALLTAPQSGRETREKLRDLADDAKEKIMSVADEAKEKIQDTYMHGKDVLQEKKSAIVSAIDAGKKAMADEKIRLAEKA